MSVGLTDKAWLDLLNAEKARADAAAAKAEQYERDWYAAKNDFGTAMAKSREALAAARRECEGLKRLRTRLDEDRSIGKALRVLVQVLDGEPTGPGDKRLAAEALSTHMDLIALAAPADGEEGKCK